MKIKTIFLLLAALAAAGISGCADNFSRPMPTVILGHPQQNFARFKGRAFVLRTISTDYVHHFKGNDWHALQSMHCLPDWAYQKELRYDLEKGWRHEHLGEGKKPPVPVDIVIRVVEASHGWPHAPNMVSDIHLPGLTIRTHSISNGESIILPLWDTDREIVPTNAAEIIYAMRALHSGNPAALRHYWSTGAASWGEHLGGLLSGHIYGIANPMSEAEAEAATGKSGKELAALCDAGGGK
ncbi:MAG TPA: hypothetical protein ENH05_06175 [Rhizobiales bacterium]|nr:hypothetical protein [Hyphomicrobiales bacterium]